MSQATELIAKQMAAGANLAKIWGDILYNVKAYGAKGNGTTDDTAAIQATIDYAISVGGKAIFFPHGTYKVTALTGLSSVVLFGDNASFSGISDIINQIGKPSSNLVYNVKDYGAKGDGTTDDTISIKAAIATASTAGGGTVYFPIGVYIISSTLFIGDGSGSAASTINNVFLQGQGIITAVFPSSTQNDATILKWAGAAGGTMVHFRGPIVGGGIDGIELKCNLVAGIGLRMTSVTCANFPRLSVQHATQKGVVLDVVTDPITIGGTFNTGYNKFGILQIYTADSPGSVALELDGNRIAPGMADSAANFFESVSLSWNGNGGKGLNLRFCDNNYFGNVVMNNSTYVSGYGIFFDGYEAGVSFPSNNVFGYLGTSHPGQSGNPGDNFAWMYGEAGAPLPALSALSGRNWDGQTFGIMRKNNSPSGNIYRTASQNILSDGTFQAVAFDNERYDTDSMHDNVTNNSRVTIKVAGTYSIKAQLRFAANATGIRAAKIRLNGVTDIALMHYPNLGAGVDTVYTFAMPDTQFVVGDYFELLVYQDSGVGISLLANANSPTMSWTRVG